MEYRVSRSWGGGGLIWHWMVVNKSPLHLSSFSLKLENTVRDTSVVYVLFDKGLRIHQWRWCTGWSRDRGGNDEEHAGEKARHSAGGLCWEWRGGRCHALVGCVVASNWNVSHVCEIQGFFFILSSGDMSHSSLRRESVWPQTF